MTASVTLPLHIVIIDLAGSVAMIVISLLCLVTARALSRSEPDNFMYGYLVWLFAALFAFSLSRSAGHILKHLLIFTNHKECWENISPISGSINTATFLAIASFTLFFHTMRRIMARSIRDKERIKKISQELLNLNQNTEAIVSERTRAELALNVAHEIRNPVMVIGGLARRMLKDDLSEEEREQRLKAILEQADRLNSIVKKFETIKGDLTWAFTRNELTRLVEDAIEVMRQEAEEKGITLKYVKKSEPLYVEGNAYLLKMSVLHCIRNGIEASMPGQEIEISTERTDIGALIRIEDHGIGIPQSMLKDIFVPFFGTKGKSSGLGLSVVKQIVEEHGGTIEITSTEGKGTVVEISLPSQLGITKSWKSRNDKNGENAKGKP